MAAHIPNHKAMYLFFSLLLLISAQPTTCRELLQQGPVSAPVSAPIAAPETEGPVSAPPVISPTSPPSNGSDPVSAPPVSAPTGAPSNGGPTSAPVVPSNGGPVSAPVAAPTGAPANAPAPTTVNTNAGGLYACPPNGNATAAMLSGVTLVGGSLVTLNISTVPGVGITFLPANFTLSVVAGGPNVSRGLLILPEEGVDPVAYAPYARTTALFGYFVVIANDRSYGTVLSAMALRPDLQYWALSGHGQGGTVAAGLVSVLYPKVKGLSLLGAALPASLNLSATNVFVSSLYGTLDTVVPPETVRSDALRYPGEALLTPYDVSHYDFAYSQCSGNDLGSTGGSALTAAFAAQINLLFALPTRIAQWAVATPRALSFGDNSLLTPGFNVSKPYPANNTGVVTFRDVSIPGTLPPRHWYVFSPPANNTRGGFIYLPGGAVDARGYFPVAFEIAARGWLCVIIQVQARIAYSYNNTDAIALLNSTDPVFASVPKNKWAIGGHSAGGGGAASFVNANPNRFLALVMMAGALRPNNFTVNPTPVVNIVGTLDRLNGPGQSYRDYVALVNPFANPNVTSPQTDIVGGSHYQMGDYGYQYFDNIPVISQDQQQSEVGQAVVSYLDRIVPRF